MVTIPSEYVRSENKQPAMTCMQRVVLEVPVIDLGSPDEDNIVRLIAEASREWGIFQVLNHGITDDTIAKLQKVGKEFFELPKEERELIAKQEEYQGVEGYYGAKLRKEVGGKKGLVDQLFHIIWPKSAINYHCWPTNPPLYREANEEYAIALRGVADKLFEALSLAIGLERHELKEASGGDDLIYMLKINYYPPCPRPDSALGTVAHTDLSAITILISNQVQGLQVHKDDHWYDVNYIPNALIILIGHQIEIMSNGKYKSVYHRANVKKDKTRMSWPVFLDPPPELRIGPISKLVTDQNPAKFKTKKYKDYVHCKLNKLPH